MKNVDATGMHAKMDDPILSCKYQRVMAAYKEGKTFVDVSNPHWEDYCGHGKETFLGTIKGLEGLIDIYVYENAGRAAICARFGEKSHEYLSCGNVMDIFHHAMFGGSDDHKKLMAKIALVLLHRLKFSVSRH